MNIREQIVTANNFAGRSLTPEEHDAWKDIKLSMEKLLAVYEAGDEYLRALRESRIAMSNIHRGELSDAINAVQTTQQEPSPERVQEIADQFGFPKVKHKHAWSCDIGDTRDKCYECGAIRQHGTGEISVPERQQENDDA